MPENVITDSDNDFVKEHVTDTLYNKIISELTIRKKGSTTGRKSSLTSEMLRQFLFYVSMGADYKEAADACMMGEGNRKDYSLRSDTFSEVSRLAKGNVSIRARVAVARAIIGTKPGYYKMIHPATKREEYIPIKEVTPNVAVAQWWLEKVDKIGGDNDLGGAPQLGAPKNEEEAKLLEFVLNRHSDYVRNKQQSGT